MSIQKLHDNGERFALHTYESARRVATREDLLYRPMNWQGSGQAIMEHNGVTYLWSAYDLTPMSIHRALTLQSDCLIWEVVSIDGELESELGAFSDAIGH